MQSGVEPVRIGGQVDGLVIGVEAVSHFIENWSLKAARVDEKQQVQGSQWKDVSGRTPVAIPSGQSAERLGFQRPEILPSADHSDRLATGVCQLPTGKAFLLVHLPLHFSNEVLILGQPARPDCAEWGSS